MGDIQIDTYTHRDVKEQGERGQRNSLIASLTSLLPEYALPVLGSPAAIVLDQSLRTETNTHHIEVDQTIIQRLEALLSGDAQDSPLEAEEAALDHIVENKQMVEQGNAHSLTSTPCDFVIYFSGSTSSETARSTIEYQVLKLEEVVRLRDGQYEGFLSYYRFQCGICHACESIMKADVEAHDVRCKPIVAHPEPSKCARLGGDAAYKTERILQRHNAKTHDFLPRRSQPCAALRGSSRLVKGGPTTLPFTTPSS